jgi:hypothetical protein
VLRTPPEVRFFSFDRETAAIDEPLRAMLGMLRKLTREHAVDADDMRGAGRWCLARANRGRTRGLLQTVDRLFRSFGYFVPSPKAHEAGPKFLLARGYR